MGDVRPNLILAAVVAVTALFGLGAGATWAFVGGLTANLLTTDPLGTVPLGLLLSAALVALLARLIGPRGALVALVGGVLGSAVLDVAAAVVLFLQGAGAPGASSLVGVIVPTAVANGLLATLLYLGGRTAVSRFVPDAPTSLG